MIFYRCLFFFYISMVSVGAFAADYYVSVNGSDGNTGSYASPWRHVQYGLGQLQPGDALYMMPGVFNEKIAFPTSGTPGYRIKLFAFQNGAILDGTGITSQDAMIEVTDRSHICIWGVELRNNIGNDAQGIILQGHCEDVIMYYNKIHDIHFSANPNDPVTENTNAQAIIIYGSDTVASTDIELRWNEVYDCRLGYSEGIAVNGNVDNFTISGNSVHGLTNIGIVAIGHEGVCPDSQLDQARNGLIEKNIVRDCRSPYAACAGIYIDGAKDTKILYNSVSHNDYGIEIGCEHPGKTASGITVRDNIIRLNGVAGMAFGGYDYPTNSGSIHNCTVYNNSFWSNDTTHDGNGELAISYAENCVIENNLFHTNDQLRAVTFADANTTTVALDYNLYYTPGNFQESLIGTVNNEFDLAQFQAFGQEQNGRFADPLISFSDDDASFAITDGLSPCINNGNSAHVPLPYEKDFFGLARMNTTGWQLTIDIGASELASGGLEAPETVVLTVYPNPAAGTIAIGSAEKWKRVEIVDLSGKSQLAAPFSPLLDISALKAGMYIVRCSNRRAVSYTTFIKL